MKRLFLILLLFISFVCVGFAQSVEVFIADPDGPYTNVRNAPKGKVMERIPTELDIILSVESPRNGWWRICEDMYYNLDGTEIHLKGSETGYWIHYSVLCVSSSNYGGQCLTLREEPSETSAAVYTFKEEILLQPIDVKDEWVKVRTEDGKHTGWIEAHWLCGNPVTYCC